MKEKTIDFPSYSAEYLDGEIGGDDSDFVPLIYDIIEQQTSCSESDSEVQSHLPTWAKQTLSSAGENIGNLDDPRRTRSDFQREGIAVSCHNSLLSETCYLMISSDPKSYYHAHKDPRGQATMDEEMNSLQKNATWELLSLPPGRKLVQ